MHSVGKDSQFGKYVGIEATMGGRKGFSFQLYICTLLPIGVNI